MQRGIVFATGRRGACSRRRRRAGWFGKPVRAIIHPESLPRLNQVQSTDSRRPIFFCERLKKECPAAKMNGQRHRLYRREFSS